MSEATLRALRCDAAVLAEQLASAGYAVLDDVLDLELVRRLRAEAEETVREGGKLAGVGRATEHVVDPTVRRDAIHWLTSDLPAAHDYLTVMEQLRLELNQQLFLGLFRFEAHYASYAVGAFYSRHRDAFRGSRNRLVSTVFYLNDTWSAEQGGALVLYANDEATRLETILPVGNRLVVFLSEEFPHEVLPALHTRYSIAGWFRGTDAR